MAESGAALKKLAKKVAEFVDDHHGAWSHDEWEALCVSISKLGIELDEGLRECLGGLAERMKVFYFCAPPNKKSKKDDPAKDKSTAKVLEKRRSALKQKSTKAGGKKKVPAFPSEDTP